MLKTMTVDKILAGFNKTLNQLQTLQEAKAAAIDSNTARIKDLENQNHAASAEMKRAAKVEKNIRSIIEV